MKKDENPHKDINDLLRDWRQGDCVIGSQNFFFSFNPKRPISKSAIVAAKDFDSDMDPLAVEEVKGFVVLTQTCDIVRDTKSRPFIDVAPLVEANPSLFAMIQSRSTPRYAEIPSLRQQRLVADLDRIMTVEKPVIAQAQRTWGCSTEEEAKLFSEALVRKWTRPALPDEFIAVLKPLQEHWKDNHDKNTGEGKLLRSLREIRVQASPSWDAPKIQVRFWFILESPINNASNACGVPVHEQIEKWLAMLNTAGTKFDIDSWAGPYSGMGADDYVVSCKLDYDHLS